MRCWLYCRLSPSLSVKETYVFGGWAGVGGWTGAVGIEIALGWAGTADVPAASDWGGVSEIAGDSGIVGREGASGCAVSSHAPTVVMPVQNSRLQTSSQAGMGDASSEVT